MGIVSSPHLTGSHDLKSKEEKGKLSECQWSNVLEAQAKRRSSRQWQVIRERRVTWKNGHNYRSRKPPRGVSMKKRAARSLEAAGSTRPGNLIERKVRTLKKLIPCSGDSNTGLEGIFREAADYILALQTRAQLLQIMVNVLSASHK